MQKFTWKNEFESKLDDLQARRLDITRWLQSGEIPASEPDRDTLKAELKEIKRKLNQWYIHKIDPFSQ